MSNGLTGTAFLATVVWVLSYAVNGELNLNYAKDAIGIIIASFFGIIFLNDISSLPVNNFYYNALKMDTDFSNDQLQTIAYASPIVSGGIFILGALVSILIPVLYGLHPLSLSVFYLVTFFPHLIQLVPSILFALYTIDFQASV